MFIDSSAMTSSGRVCVLRRRKSAMRPEIEMAARTINRTLLRRENRILLWRELSLTTTAIRRPLIVPGEIETDLLTSSNSGREFERGLLAQSEPGSSGG